MPDDTSTVNVKKHEKLMQVLEELLTEVLHRGFYGTGVIEIGVQDGTIQYIRRRVDRIEK